MIRNSTLNSLVVGFVILFTITFSVQGTAEDTPVIITIPTSVAGVKTPTVSLNGTWKFTTTPPEQFWLNSITAESWKEIQVPGEALMQGFNIMQDVEYPYKRKIHIPDDFKGKRIFIQFDGVYCYSRIWVNGIFIRNHHGGFTTWNCEITDQAIPGETAWITVGVTDRSDDISYGSAYSHHNIGGILFDVRLIALPPDPIPHFHIETVFDDTYTNANLQKSVAKALQSMPLKYSNTFMTVEPGTVIEKTFYLDVYKIATEGTAFQRPVHQSLEIFKPYYTGDLPAFLEIIQSKYLFTRSRWLEDDDYKGFNMYPDIHIPEIVMGWAGQAASCGYALQVLQKHINEPEIPGMVQQSLDLKRWEWNFNETYQRVIM